VRAVQTLWNAARVRPPAADTRRRVTVDKFPPFVSILIFFSLLTTRRKKHNLTISHSFRQTRDEYLQPIKHGEILSRKVTVYYLDVALLDAAQAAIRVYVYHYKIIRFSLFE